MGKIKLTPKNYKKFGYDYWYKLPNGQLRFTRLSDDGNYEEVYDNKGKFIGEFD